MTQFRPFSATVRSANGAAIVDLHGEINANAEAFLNGAYAEAIQGQPDRLLLNFGDVDYINSTGIALLVTILIRAQRAKQKLLVCGLNEHYQQIFALTRLNEAISIYGSEAEAVAAV